ncbi:MAG: flagellar export chaperone FliS [Nitrosopumilaceae archaeon]|nr:flagellar export chaperone FliS [Nitrosopumilaceae archaeon]
MNQVYNPYQTYKRQKNTEIQTADRVKLVCMLMEGAICFNKKAIMAMEGNDKSTALQLSDRGSKIVLHLYESLDLGQEGELLTQLTSLYSFMLNSYALFVKKENESIEPLESINRVLSTLLDAWKKIDSGEVDWKGDLENE